jgi:5-hydroxyisourate hydrolase-like protein (transthyretin family)
MKAYGQITARTQHVKESQMTRQAWMATQRCVARPLAAILSLTSVIISVAILLGTTPARAATNPALETSLPAGAANGTPASRSAVLSPVSPGSISRTYEHSAFRVSSRLVNASGQPIVGARIDILQRVAYTYETQVIAQSTTSADGSFSVIVPSGASRTIDIAYRPFESDPIYAAQTEVYESVAAGVQLQITATHTSSTGTVVFGGRVLGNVPAHGVVVELLVYYEGQWQPIRTPRTTGAGSFRAVYQFHQAYGQFPFKAGVRGGQAGFPYRGGYSGAVEVTAQQKKP